MSKILYIEDQLTKNITTIRKLFFSEDINRTLLDDIENSEYKTSKQIIEACNLSISYLDVSNSFLDALDKVINNYRDYELVLIDRNLIENPYHNDIICIKEYLGHIGFDDPEATIKEYETREGDLLLLILLRLDSDRKLKDKIYYLTANLDELRGSQTLKTLIDVNDFYANHIIEKNPEKVEFLRKHISNIESFKIQNDFKPQCDIIRKKLGEDIVEEFITMIKHYNNDAKAEFMLYLRGLLANDILEKIANIIDESHSAPYWKRENNNQLYVKSFINGIPLRDQNGSDIYDKTTGKKIWCGLRAYNEKNDIGYTSVIRNACLSIAEICSDYIHKDFYKNVPVENVKTDFITSYTMRTLLNQICEIIKWYNETLDLISNIKSQPST